MWQQIKFQLNAAHSEEIASFFEAFGALAVTSQNAGEDAFYEVAFPQTPSWQNVMLTVLFEQDSNVSDIINFVQNYYQNKYATCLSFAVENVADQNWQRSWLDSFKPIQVGKDLWVCPSWCAPEEPQAKNLFLDPGLAFGTGTHETTAMCLSWLCEQDLNNVCVLDYGCGSGILAIAALLLGAKHATAVDIDPLAVQSSQENAQKNALSTDVFNACLPNELDTTRPYQLLIANILANTLIELKPTLDDVLAPKGTILLTGILENQAKSVKQAYNNYQFTTLKQDCWCLLIGTKQMHV